jgi:hypothetical protein
MINQKIVQLKELEMINSVREQTPSRNSGGSWKIDGQPIQLTEDHYKIIFENARTICFQ